MFSLLTRKRLANSAARLSHAVLVIARTSPHLKLTTDAKGVAKASSLARPTISFKLAESVAGISILGPADPMLEKKSRNLHNHLAMMIILFRVFLELVILMQGY